MAKLTILVTGLVLVLPTVAGCAARGAGTRPSDMTPDRHCAEARADRAKAATERMRANHVPGSKPAVEGRLRAEYLQAARRFEQHADQHEQAALVAAGPYVSPCAR